MLVLARRESEKVLFPTLGITVEVLRVQGGITRLGIDAPEEVPIVRAEIADLKSLEFATDNQSAQVRLSLLSHLVRHRLNSAAGMLNRLHEVLERSEHPAAADIVLDVFREIQTLDREALRAIESEPQAGPMVQTLLVNENANERELLAGYLRLNGFEVTTAASERDALNFLSLHARPDVVLFDLNQPPSDGVSLVREIRNNTAFSGLKLFALSGAEPRESGLSVGPLGIDRWFPKPIDPEKLVDEMTRALESTAA